MSDDIDSRNDLLAQRDQAEDEIADLKQQLAKAETARLAWTEIGAKAQADAGAFLGTIYATRTLLSNRPIKTPFDDDVIRLLQHTIDERKGPGAVLLAELEAARAVVAVLEANRIHGRCPLCGELSDHKAGCALGRYNEAVKARAE